jgi:lysophospholipase L1-like esterase
MSTDSTTRSVTSSATVASHGTVLFIGDSLTECGRDFADPGSLGDGYVALFAEHWDRAYPHSPITVLNRGISGNRVVDLQARWTEDAVNVRPDVAFVMVGINDTWRRYDNGDPTSLKQYTAGYREILNRLRAETTAQIVLIEPFLLPVTAEQWTWREDLDPKITAVRMLAAEFGAILVCADGRLNETAARIGYDFARLAADGVHLAGEGKEVLALACLEVVAPQ